MSATSDEDAAACAELVRSHDFLRYATTLFASERERRALTALYAFNVEISRIRDRVTSPVAGEIRLQWWADMLQGEGHGGVMGSPVAAQLQAAIEAFALPVEDLLALIEARRGTIGGERMATMAALQDHLVASIAPLFATTARIRGGELAGADDILSHASLALGLVSAPVTERHLLPAEFVPGPGGTITPEAGAKLVAAARQHLDSAFSCLSRLAPAARPAFLHLSVLRHQLRRGPTADDKLPEPCSHLRILWTLWRAARGRDFN